MRPINQNITGLWLHLHRIRWWVGVLLFCGLLYVFNSDAPNSSITQPTSQSGELNLSHWQFDRNGPVNLNGQWAFHWDKLLAPDQLNSQSAAINVDVPGYWTDKKIAGKHLPNEGHGTYSLVIQGLKPHQYGLMIPTTYSANKIWLDDKPVAQSGVVGTNADDTQSLWQAHEVFFTATDKPVRLTMQMATYDHAHFDGGITRAITLGTAEQIHYLRLKSSLTDFVTVAIFLILGFYQLIVFVRRPTDRVGLYFAGFSLLVAFGGVLTRNSFLYLHWFELDFALYQRLIYLCQSFIAILFLKYIGGMYPKHCKAQIVRWFGYASIGYFALMLLLTPNEPLISRHLFSLIMTTIILYGLSCVISAARSKVKGSKVFLLGVAFVSLSQIYEILLANDIMHPLYVNKDGPAALAIIIFVICQTWLLATRHGDTLIEKKQVQSLNQSILQSISTGIMAIDRQNRIQQVNDSICLMLRRDRLQLHGLPIKAVIDPSDAVFHRALSTLGKSSEPQKIYDHCLTITTAHSIPANLTISPLLDEKAMNNGVVICIEDISEQKKVALQLKEKQQQSLQLAQEKRVFELARDEKNRFFAAASHDLRQPVYALQLLHDHLHNHLQNAPDKVSAIIKDIKHNTGQLENLVETLLEIGQIDQGGLQTDITEFSLDSLLQSLHSEHAIQAQAKGLDFKMLHTSTWGKSDIKLLSRLLSNLLGNAIRYTTSGRIVLGCRRTIDTISIVVADTGPGIAPTDQTAIFKEFYQLAGSTNDGLGLGLSIVKRLCALLHHDIQLSSTEQKGTIFTVQIPRVSAPKVNKPLIAIVENDPVVRNALVRQINVWGFQTLAGADRQSLEQQLEPQHPPQLVLSDYRLQNKDTGIDVITALRSHYPDHIPAIVATAEQNPDILGRIAQFDCRFCPKPISPRYLYQVIDEQLAF